MKHIAYALLINTTLAFGAATSITGPLEVGKFHPYVTQTATNQINKGYFPTNKWQQIGKKGVDPYFKAHKDQLKASSLYVAIANNDVTVRRHYERARNCTGEVTKKVALWLSFALSALNIFAVQEAIQEAILERDLKSLTVAGANPSVLSLLEDLSLGGSFAAAISIMNAIYKNDPEAFKELYKEFLPEEPESTDGETAADITKRILKQ